MPSRATLRHRLDHAAVLGLEGLLRCLPGAARRALGRRLGAAAHRLLSRRRRGADDGLRRAFPELDDAGRRRAVRGSFAHLGAVTCDLLAAGRLDEVGFCRRLILEGWEHLNDAEARGRGVVLSGAGTACWELAALAVGLYRGPMDILDRPLDNPLLARKLGRLRTRFGNRVVAAGEAPVRMIGTLHRRGRVGLPLDRRPRPGVAAETGAVPFLGRPAPIAALAARLALDAGAPILPAFCRPAVRGRHHIVIGPAICAGDDLGQDDKAEWLIQRLIGVIEEQIRQQPELWPWPCERGP